LRRGIRSERARRERIFEAHGWIELLEEGEAAAARAVKLRDPPSECTNGLVAECWRNSDGYVHVARRWDHREPGEAASEQLPGALGADARDRADVLCHGEIRCAKWRLEAGEFPRRPVENTEYRPWTE
jgi:hypothetical protein